MAKRLVAVLAYFAMCGQLTSQRLGDVETLEAALDDEQTFQKAVRRLNRVLAGLDLALARDTGADADPRETFGADQAEGPVAAAPGTEALREQARKQDRPPHAKRTLARLAGEKHPA